MGPGTARPLPDARAMRALGKYQPTCPTSQSTNQPSTTFNIAESITADQIQPNNRPTSNAGGGSGEEEKEKEKTGEEEEEEDWGG
eukprot:8231565-Pyramimonas_sp.AAC.1